MNNLEQLLSDPRHRILWNTIKDYPEPFKHVDRNAYAVHQIIAGMKVRIKANSLPWYVRIYANFLLAIKCWRVQKLLAKIHKLPINANIRGSFHYVCQEIEMANDCLLHLAPVEELLLKYYADAVIRRLNVRSSKK